MRHNDILLIEDTPSLQMVYEALLRSAGLSVYSAGTAQEGEALFQEISPRVIVLDLMLPDRDGLELMQSFLAKAPDTQVIVITANGSINRAVEAMRAGAHDFLVKPFDESRFVAAVENAFVEGARLARDMPPAKDAGYHGFIGRSPEMQEVYRRIDSVSRSMATVFITGESGTGKEVCAQAIHDSSARSDKPFIPLNCGAIPRDLLESEVFGHLRGSFTGAIVDKVGAAAAADGGTLFLDEICEMDLKLQTKLLRFLQTSTIQPVGANKPRKVNVRIICATNRDPLVEVREGRFREDLYYRLQVVPIHLPPLRSRGSDVIEIARDALKRLSSEENGQFTGMTQEVETLFSELPWPGNVRQLLNVIRNIVILNTGPLVSKNMLPLEILHHHEEVAQRSYDVQGTYAADEATSNPSAGGLVGRTMAEIERIVIEETIARNGGSVTKAARVLDLSPSTIYRKRESWVRAAAE
ncbi:sigma-54-dependent transcriptional regulator [Tropicimonas sp. S265A]|uniref:sigma-54-dependent transcriptional regulator n=1 Tax=Tropicimonas sp. S265A TaxID=3415134 RepID=UPI003C7B87E9